MSEIVQILLGFYVGYSILAVLMCVIQPVVINDTYYFTPRYIYKNSGLNIVGCVFQSVIYILINPIYCLVGIIAYIYTCISSLGYWLMHVGRNK